MNCSSTIPVYELLGSSIHTREASSFLKQLVESNPCDHIELDFSHVDQISRAFADQLYFDKFNVVKNTHKTISISNASENVVNMFRAVEKSQNIVDRKVYNIPIYRYASHNQLQNFLLGF
jgi:hypothetical protein